MRRRGIAGLASTVIVLALAAPPGARAEIYRWVDASGQVHFTEDLRQVPPAQRRAAESAAKAPGGDSPVQVYSAPPARRAPRTSRVPSPGDASTRTHRIRVQQAGSSMRVRVRINDRLDVPFLIDTGATDVVLPQWAARELGLDLENARTGRYATANGVVEQKLVRLDSVSLQGAAVEDVPATVSPSMREGLLGLSYWNHFKYDIDPVNGIVTLKRNALAETGVLRGGKSRAQWRQHFAVMHARIAAAQKRREEVPFSRSRQRAAAEEEIARLERELRLLHAEADDMRVPMTWRD
jgi:clan AA aspartic protease (TIGR02281 family)